jgi:hypothetical protein
MDVHQILGFAGFMAGGLTASLLMHLYVRRRLVQDARLPPPWPRLLSAVLVVMAVVMPAGMVLTRAAPAGLTRVVAWPLFTWMGLVFVACLILLAVDVARVAARVVLKLARVQPTDPGRRLALQRGLAVGVAGATMGLSGAGLRRVWPGPVVKEVSVTLPHLPRELDGFTMAHVTDFHLGLTLGQHDAETVVETVNGMRPDLVAVTGDLVDGTVEGLTDVVAPLRNLVSTHGTFFVTGNHEYYAGLEAWMERLTRLGFRVLRNERVSVGEGPASFDLAGVHDFAAARFGTGHVPDLGAALRGRDASRALVLLAHQPRAFPEAAAAGVGLQLSGHTHGGQIWPWGYAAYLQQGYLKGLYREGAAQMYVSCGTGYWGPPSRLGTESEVTRVILRAPPAA